jgi:hypothetical protein
LSKFRIWHHTRSGWYIPGTRKSLKTEEEEVHQLVASQTAADIVDKLTKKASLIEALLEAALILWPEARHSSTDAQHSRSS